MGSDAPETVAAIVAAHRAGTMTPAQTCPLLNHRPLLSAHPRSQRPGRVHQPARREGGAGGGRSAGFEGCGGASAIWRTGRGEGQYRRAGNADHGRLPGVRLFACAGFDGGGKVARGRRHHHRQDQSRPVRDRPRRRPLALRHSRQSGARRSRSGRIEFGFGGCGFRRSRAAGARHRYGGQRPCAGDAQQYRRAEAEPRADLQRRAGAGVQDAGLHFGVLADGR